MNKKIRVSVFKETTDDWCPSFEIKGDARYKYHLVEVSYLELSDGMWRVCVWGQDDMGMERDFEPHERVKAWEVFISIIEQQYVSYDFIKNLGFYGA